MSDAYVFDTETFCAQLPWFYHAGRADRGLADFSKPCEHKYWSFEVNGLPIDPGRFDIRFFTRQAGGRMQLSWDGESFAEYEISQSGCVDVLGRSVRNRMVSCFWRCPEAKSGEQPVTKVLLAQHGADLSAAENGATEYEAYRRNIRLSERAVFRDWPGFFDLLVGREFGVVEMEQMFRDIVAWVKTRQVTNERDLHYGAVYSEEDKYDFRDTAAAAVCFMHVYKATRDDEWEHRARIAIDYVHKGQCAEPRVAPTNKEKYGGFVHMISGTWGTDFRQLSDPWPGVDGVDTCIIANLLCTAHELGLPSMERDMRVLRRIATWVENNELRPGVFAHHEGAEHDCQNSNALGAAALTRVYHFLSQRGQRVPNRWLDAAARGIRHCIEGQEAIGEWPYVFATVGRGQAYHEQSLPDQGMGLYHFLVACQYPPFNNDPAVKRAALRAARWYLCMTYVDEDSGTIDLDYDRSGQGLCFSSFTWCRFTCAASLARMWRLTGETEPWRHLAVALMEHVRKRRWNIDDKTRAPVARSAIPDIKLHSWIQAAEWDAVLLHELIGALKSMGGG